MRCTKIIEFKILKLNTNACKQVVDNFPEYSGQPTSHWVRVPRELSKSLNPDGQPYNSPANRKLLTPNGISYNFCSNPIFH